MRKLAALQLFDDGRNAQEPLCGIRATRFDSHDRDVDMEIEAFLEERLRACVGAGMVLRELIEIGDPFQHLPGIQREQFDLGEQRGVGAVVITDELGQPLGPARTLTPLE